MYLVCGHTHDKTPLNIGLVYNSLPIARLLGIHHHPTQHFPGPAGGGVGPAFMIPEPGAPLLQHQDIVPLVALRLVTGHGVAIVKRNASIAVSAFGRLLAVKLLRDVSHSVNLTSRPENHLVGIHGLDDTLHSVEHSDAVMILQAHHAVA